MMDAVEAIKRKWAALYPDQIAMMNGGVAEKIAAALPPATKPYLGGDLSKMREALERIAGGHFDGIGNLALAGAWKAICEKFQEIAREAFTTAPESAAQASGRAGQAGDEGAHVTVGLGLCDIGPIKSEGRTGVLIRPRENHIPFGEPGELQNTEYWPRKGDVVIWVEGDGPGVLIKELAALDDALLSAHQRREAE